MSITTLLLSPPLTMFKMDVAVFCVVAADNEISLPALFFSAMPIPLEVDEPFLITRLLLSTISALYNQAEIPRVDALTSVLEQVTGS